MKNTSWVVGLDLKECNNLCKEKKNILFTFAADIKIVTIFTNIHS